MKVVNIISGKDLGGPKQSFIDYGLMLTNLGFEVHYIVRPKAKCLLYLQDIPKSRLHIVNYYRANLPPIKQYSISQLQSCLNKIKPKLIFSHKQFDLMLLKLAFPQAKLIGIIHGFNAKNTEYADQLFAVSSAVTNWLSSKTKTPCTTIPNAIEIPKQNNLVKINNKTITIGTMAVFRRKKQLEHLLKAGKILAKKQLDFNIIIAGRGHRKIWLQLLIYYFGLQNQVKIISWVNNKAHFFKQIDIYCITSKTESFNISLIEAMAHKVPVIASNCGGPSDIIIHNKTGMLYPTSNVKLLASQLECLITQTQFRNNLAIAGFIRVKNNFCTKIISKKIKEKI